MKGLRPHHIGISRFTDRVEHFSLDDPIRGNLGSKLFPAADDAFYSKLITFRNTSVAEILLVGAFPEIGPFIVQLIGIFMVHFVRPLSSFNETTNPRFTVFDPID